MCGQVAIANLGKYAKPIIFIIWPEQKLKHYEKTKKNSKHKRKQEQDCQL